MTGTLASKLTPQLAQHLSGIDLQTLSRIDAARLSRRALPNIGAIELVSSADFAPVYDELYVKMFPKRAERERSDLIVARLEAQGKGEREGLAPYRVVGIRDERGEAIGAAQFSVLPLGGKGEGLAVPYLQYVYVREENRRQDMSEVLHAVVLGVAVADAREMSGGDGERSVPLTLFETEPPGHGDDEEERAFSTARAMVHTNGGAVAVVLVRKDAGDEGGGEEVRSPHVQPGLEEGAPPLSLVWAVRRRRGPLGQGWRIEEVGRELVRAYYRSLRDEGFPEENIRLAEGMVEERCEGCEWRLVPLDEVTFHQRD